MNLGKPNRGKMVLAYVHSRELDYLLITLAIYDIESERWLDMMRDEKEESNLNVAYWVDIKDVELPYKNYTSMKMHRYREIYLRNVGSYEKI